MFTTTSVWDRSHTLCLGAAESEVTGSGRAPYWCNQVINHEAKTICPDFGSSRRDEFAFDARTTRIASPVIDRLSWPAPVARGDG